MPLGVITNILEQISFHGEATSPWRRSTLWSNRTPSASWSPTRRRGTFLVVTTPEIHDELRERSSDIEAYMQRMIREQDRD